MDDETILKERVKKLKLEIETARRRRKLGVHPLKIADELIHEMLVSMKNILMKQFPNATEEEIKLKMRKQMEIYDKKKNF